MHTLIQSDLEDIAGFDPSLWLSLKGKNIFATGCTGFIGGWIIHSFLYFNQKYDLGASLTLLTRNKQKLLAHFPAAADKSIIIHEGDITSFNFPQGNFEYIIHGATEVAPMQNGNNQSGFLDNAYLGTKRIIEFSRLAATQRILFLSSGAAYGAQPLDLPVFQENYAGAPLTTLPTSSYGEAKRFAEQMLFNESQFETVSARIFATCGPFIPLESKFAFINFLEDCLRGKDITINDNGRSTRSYLYASDLALWLWHLLMKGKRSEIYNVGSEQEISIKDLAGTIKKVLNSSSNVTVLGKSESYNRYIPSTKKMLDQFNLRPTVTLEDAIIKTSRFLKEQYGF